MTLFQTESGNYYFYHNDHLGTPQALTDVIGEIVWEASYEAFGKADIDPNSTITNNLRFPGQYFDEETGLHWNWMRYFDPGVGRYLENDPLGLKGGINLFAYVQNRPINLIDPWGLLSYLVSRSLQGQAGSYASHNFIVTNANFIGDPNATVHSFGKNNIGNVGRVNNSTTGFSAGTHRTDIAAWNALNGRKKSCQDVSLINAPDAIVDAYANSLIENQDYAAVAGPFGANSNSAAQAIANRAAQTYVQTPGGSRLSPGAGSWREIRFNVSVLSSAP